MTTIHLPISYEEALKGAKPITIEQTTEELGVQKKIPVIIPPLNTNIAFTMGEVMKFYRPPKTNIYNNGFNIPRQSKYKNGHTAW